MKNESITATATARLGGDTNRWPRYSERSHTVRAQQDPTIIPELMGAHAGRRRVSTQENLVVLVAILQSIYNRLLWSLYYHQCVVPKGLDIARN